MNRKLHKRPRFCLRVLNIHIWSGVRKRSGELTVSKYPPNAEFQKNKKHVQIRLLNDRSTPLRFEELNTLSWTVKRRCKRSLLPHWAAERIIFSVPNRAYMAFKQLCTCHSIKRRVINREKPSQVLIKEALFDIRSVLLVSFPVAIRKCFSTGSIFVSKATQITHLWDFNRVSDIVECTLGPSLLLFFSLGLFAVSHLYRCQGHRPQILEFLTPGIRVYYVKTKLMAALISQYAETLLNDSLLGRFTDKSRPDDKAMDAMFFGTHFQPHHRSIHLMTLAYKLRGLKRTFGLSRFEKGEFFPRNSTYTFTLPVKTGIKAIFRPLES